MRRLPGIAAFLLLLGSGAAAQEPASTVEDTAETQAADTLAADTLPAEVPEEIARSDERLQEELNAIFDRIPGLEGVRARVEAGVVVLSGRTLSVEARNRAEALAESMPGVVFVANRVEQVASLPARVRTVLRGARDRIVAFIAYLPLLILALAVVALFWLLAHWVGKWDGLYRRLAAHAFAQNVLRQGFRGAVLLAGFILALQFLEVTAVVGAVLGAAGIAGLALGFAFRAVAESYLAGLFLSLRQPFDPSDHVVVGEHEGKVVRLTARDTILLTLEGNHLRIPNATVFGSVILNYTRNPLRRFDFPVSVGEEEDLTTALAEGVAALDAMPGVLGDPAPFGRVRELGDGFVQVRFFGWVDQREADQDKVRSEAIRKVKARLDGAGISMPPTAYLVQMQEAAGPGGALYGREPAEIRPEAAEARKPTPEPARKPEPARGPAEEAEVQDISVDRVLDEQIEEDRRVSGEEDLLAPREDGVKERADEVGEGSRE